MADLRQIEFFVLRYVPDAVKDEFVNIGVMAVEADGGFAEVRFTRDWRRVKCLDPDVDVEVLEALEREIRGRMADVADRELMLQKLEESLSNNVQMSAAKGCLTEDPQKEMEELASLYLESRRRAERREAAGRQRILGAMRGAFEQAGVWKLMRHNIAAAQYTYKGDPLKIDCGYRPNGEIKLFQAVSLGTDVDAAKVLAFSYTEIEAGIRRVEGAGTSLTAVVEDELDRGDEAVLFALATLEKSRIAVAAVGEMGRIAEVARREMRV
jgi:hypothetical protein